MSYDLLINEKILDFHLSTITIKVGNICVHEEMSKINMTILFTKLAQKQGEHARSIVSIILQHQHRKQGEHARRRLNTCLLILGPSKFKLSFLEKPVPLKNKKMAFMG